MYPLLALGASNLATKFLDSLGQALQPKLSPAGGASFEALLPQRSAAAVAGTSSAVRPVTTMEDTIAKLRQQLLNAPELQTLLNTADPAKGASLSISSGGIVTYTPPDGRTTALSLSPASSATARELGAALTLSGAPVNAMGSMPLLGVANVRRLS